LESENAKLLEIIATLTKTQEENIMKFTRLKQQLEESKYGFWVLSLLDIASFMYCCDYHSDLNLLQPTDARHSLPCAKKNRSRVIPPAAY
jgi:hypothetical protein